MKFTILLLIPLLMFGGDIKNQVITDSIYAEHGVFNTSFVADSANVGKLVVQDKAMFDVNDLLIGGEGGFTPQLNINYLPTETTPSEINTDTYDALGFMGQFPSGKFVTIYRQSTGHVGAGIYGIVRMRTSTDNGKIWGSATTIANESGIDLNNPAGGITPNGRLVVMYARYEPDAPAEWLSIEYIYSDDEGVAWSSPATLPTNPMTAFSPYGGLISIADNKVLVSWYGNDGTNYTVNVIISSDNGKTWGSPIEVITSTTVQYTEASFAYVGGGAIVGLIRMDNGTTFNQVKSTDNGDTWTDQGNTTFDSWPTATPAWLSVFNSLGGRRMVAAYFRDDTKLCVILGLAQELIVLGVSGWQVDTNQDLADVVGGYPSVVYPFNSPYGIGRYYYEKSTSDADIRFFTWPPLAFARYNTVWGKLNLMGGNIGIGTENPSAKLQIQGTTDSVMIDASGNIIATANLTANSITQFLYVDLDIDDTEEYELTVADGKAGWGMASLEDEWTFFRFTAVGGVTLVNNTTNVTITDGTDNNFNIFDAGSTIKFENQLGDDKELNINVWFTP